MIWCPIEQATNSQTAVKVTWFSVKMKKKPAKIFKHAVKRLLHKENYYSVWDVFMHLIVASVIKKWVLLIGEKNNINSIVTGEKGNTENIKNIYIKILQHLR